MNTIIHSDINKMSPLLLIWLYIVSNRLMTIQQREKIIKVIHNNYETVLLIYKGLLKISSSSGNPSFARAANNLIHNSLNVKGSVYKTTSIYYYDSMVYKALLAGTDFSLSTVLLDIYSLNKEYVIDSGIKLIMYKIYYNAILHNENNSTIKYLNLLKNVATFSIVSKVQPGMLYIDNTVFDETTIGIITDNISVGLTPLGLLPISKDAIVLNNLKRINNG